MSTTVYTFCCYSSSIIIVVQIVVWIFAVGDGVGVDVAATIIYI